jgi:hypothetical protein
MGFPNPNLKHPKIKRKWKEREEVEMEIEKMEELEKLEEFEEGERLEFEEGERLEELLEKEFEELDIFETYVFLVIGGAYIVGLVLFCILLVPATNPELYNSVYYDVRHFPLLNDTKTA